MIGLWLFSSIMTVICMLSTFISMFTSGPGDVFLGILMTAFFFVVTVCTNPMKGV